MYNILKGGNVIPVLAIGAGAALLAPVVFGVVGGILRPVAKAMIKGSIVAYDKIRESGAEAMETLEDLTAEVKAEVGEEAKQG